MIITEFIFNDKDAIEETLNIIDKLLSEENVGNLTVEEKTAIEEQKADLEEKLGDIEAAEGKMETVEDTVSSLPEADKVTGENKTAIEDALDVIEDLLSEENVGNLTAEEKATVEEQKAELTGKLDVIQIVEDTIDILQNERDNIPSKDVITTESKDEVVELLDIIKDLQENNPSNLTEEQKVVIEGLREELQGKIDRIQMIEDSLNEIENESAALPGYDDITSDNKEDIKDIIKDIENILTDEKENLSQEEKEALEEQKKELEDKVSFIEEIEKYEPVSGDFKNTTEPKSNDLNADLANGSNELIGIIPLEKTEKEHVAKSEDVKVYLEVSDITKTITEDAKELIETEIEDKEIAIYLDINLFKQIGEREPKKIPNTNGLVTITFRVPSSLVNTDSSVTRKYQVVRIHEGKVTIIDVVYDETTGMISFETDQFSTYAIVYKDQPIENDAGENDKPNADGNNNQNVGENSKPNAGENEKNNAEENNKPNVDSNESALNGEQQTNIPKAEEVASIPSETEELLSDALEKIQGIVPGIQPGPYVEISKAQAGEGNEEQQFTIEIPNELIKDGRTYYLVAVDDKGNIVVLQSEDIKDGVLTFTGNPNFIYQIVYEDGVSYLADKLNENGYPVDENGDVVTVEAANCFWHYIILVSALIGIVLLELTLLLEEKAECLL